MRVLATHKRAKRQHRVATTLTGVVADISVAQVPLVVGDGFQLVSQGHDAGLHGGDLLHVCVGILLLLAR